MPLKLNVGLSRKVGQANYGSRGASVNVELELDSTLVQRPDELHGRIRQLFVLARDAVDEELQADARHNGAAPVANGNGHHEPAPPATAGMAAAPRPTTRTSAASTPTISPTR